MDIMDINQIQKATRYANDVDIPQDLRFLIKSLLKDREELMGALQHVALTADRFYKNQKKWR